MRVAVTGATGLIGTAVVRALRSRGDEVVALTRDPDRARDVLGAEVEAQAWPKPKQSPPPPKALEHADAVIHLLGDNVKYAVDQYWRQASRRFVEHQQARATH